MYKRLVEDTHKIKYLKTQTQRKFEIKMRRLQTTQMSTEWHSSERETNIRKDVYAMYIKNGLIYYCLSYENFY